LPGESKKIPTESICRKETGNPAQTPSAGAFQGVHLNIEDQPRGRFPKSGFINPARILRWSSSPLHSDQASQKNSPRPTVKERSLTATKSPNFFTKWSNSIICSLCWNAGYWITRFRWFSTRALDGG